jgi:hypothetical protein
MAEFKEGNLLVADDKGIFFGDSQSASITYNPETDQLVFSAFETAGLTKIFYTMRELGTATIVSGTSYVDIDFGGEQMPTSTYTSVFQISGADDWYPSYITQKTPTGFRIEIGGTAREDLTVDYLCHADTLDTTYGKSYVFYITGDRFTFEYLVDSTPGPVAFITSQEATIKNSVPVEVREGYFVDVYKNFYPIIPNSMCGYDQFDIYTAGNTQKIYPYGQPVPVQLNVLFGDVATFFDPATLIMSSGAVISPGALTLTVSLFQQYIDTDYLVFCTLRSMDTDVNDDTQYLYTVQKGTDSFTINFQGTLQTELQLYYTLIKE